MGVAAIGGAIAYYKSRKQAAKADQEERKEEEFEFEVEKDEEVHSPENVYLTPTGPGMGESKMVEKDPRFEDP